MIETTYVRLDRAAEMLGTESDTLLIAAVEKRIGLHGLLNKAFAAEKGYYDEYLNKTPDDSPFWVPCEVRTQHFLFVPLAYYQAADVLLSGQADVSGGMLSEPEESGEYWRDAEVYSRVPSDLPVGRDAVFLKRQDIEKYKTAGALPPERTKELPGEETPQRKAAITKRTNTLQKLVIGMAMRGYGYNPNDHKSDAISVIVADLDCVGASLDSGTVRANLKNAAEVLDMLPEESS